MANKASQYANTLATSGGDVPKSKIINGSKSFVGIHGCTGTMSNDQACAIENEDNLEMHVVAPKIQKFYPPDVDLLIIHALEVPRHQTVPDAFIFHNFPVKIVNLFGTVIAKRTFGTMQSYYVSDDTGAIWINVPEKVHTLSHHETDTKVLNSRLEKQERTLKNGSEDDAMVHGVLRSLMKEVNELMSKSSEPLPLGTVLKVRGWLLDSNGFRKVRAIQLSFIDDPHTEAEMMAYLASLYRQLYAPK